MFNESIQLRDTTSPVVFVDDDFDDRRTAERCYKRAGVPNPFLTFKMGSEFLSYLDQVTVGEQPLPALVLLDIRMPQMNGFEVLAHVRSQSPYRQVPVIMMLTNSDYERDIERARELGADGYQEKPSEITAYVDFFRSLVSADAPTG